MSENEQKYDTLVLSGGGINGFYLIGALQAIMDADLHRHFSTYVGTSIGSILGYLLAIGYTPMEIIIELYTTSCLDRLQSFNLISMINGNGATTFTSLHEALEKLTLKKIGRFLTLGKLRETLGKTLICTTYNMTVCATEYLGPDNYPDLPCLTALRMSANLPLVFDRFQYMDSYYVDGWITDNFPILKGEEVGTRVLGLYLKIDEKSLHDDPEDGVMSYILRLLQLPIVNNTINKAALAGSKCTVIPVYCGPKSNSVDFNVKSKVRLDMFSKGYESVKSFFRSS